MAAFRAGWLLVLAGALIEVARMGIPCPGVSLPVAEAAPAPPSADAILAKIDDLYRSTSSIGRLELVAVTPRTTRTLTIKAWTRGEDDALIVIESPPREAGTATLRVGQNLWNYLPRIARTIRVPASMMLGSWMGTDFTNDDLVKESSLRKDFEARVERRSVDPPGWWLTLDVKPGIVGRWARIEILVTDDWLPVEERHYDRKGRLARTMEFRDVRAMGGRRLPTRIVLTPKGEEKRRTEMRYLEIVFDVKLPDDTFTLSRLERTR